MCETISELNFQSMMNFDQLEFGLETRFQEFIPDMFQEASMVPDMSTGVLYPALHQDFAPMPLSTELKPELCDLSNSHYALQPEPQQQQHYQHEWKSFNVPSTTASPVQFEGMNFNTVPTGYEQQQFYHTNFVNGRKRRAADKPCEAALEFDATFQGGYDQNGGKPKRRRVQNARQRSAANVRERKRMLHLNEAFDSLKTRVPTFAYEKRLSRIETLKLAMTYISFMTQVIDGKKPDEISLGEDGLDSFSIEDLGRFKSALSSSYISDGTESSDSGTSSS